MPLTNFPSVSIIIVNYNGRHLISACLTALFKISYPTGKYEVIVVDNNSQDNSVTFIKKQFPRVKLIESKVNYGFTGGNDLGMKKAKGECLVLLNSDVVVDKNWLTGLVDAARPPKVGLVASKLYLSIPFFELKIKSKIIPKSDIAYQTDYSPIGVIVENVVCQNKFLNKLVWYESGFYEKKKANITTRWTSGEGVILLPFQAAYEENFTLKIHGYPDTQGLLTPVQVIAGDQVVIKDKIKANEVKQYKLNIKRSMIRAKLIWLVQNAGNLLLHNGYGKDRGSLIRYSAKENLEFYDRDHPYYDQPKQLLAVCGASCLIKKQVIDEVGFLDGCFFMYYEDLDFSFRAWKRGWDIVYAPDSIGYHQHRASTKVGNQVFFKALIERNHLYFTITHFPVTTFLKVGCYYLLSLLMTIMIANVLRFVDNIGAYKKWNLLAEEKIKATSQLIEQLSQLMYNRNFWRQREVRTFSQARKLMY